MDSLSLVELQKLGKETDEKANAIRNEIHTRLNKIRNEKLRKLFYMIKKKYGIKNLYSISERCTGFRINNKIYNCRFVNNSYEFSIEIDSGKGYYDNEWLYYKYVNDNFEFDANCKLQENINYHNNFINTNPKLFECIKIVETQKYKLFADYQKYYNLFFKTNYYLSLTFLLCTKKIFPRDISKLIAHKILFFFCFFGCSFGPFWFFMNQKGPKGRLGRPIKKMKKENEKNVGICEE